MKCSQVQNLLCEYIDDALADHIKKDVDCHLIMCEQCQEELRVWQDSEALIFSTRPLFEEEVETVSVVDQVMNRIQKEEKRMPSSHRLSARVRRWGMLAASVFFVVFTLGLFYTPDDSQASVPLNGEWESLEVSNAISSVETIGIDTTGSLEETAEGQKVVASIGDPMIYSLSDEEQKRNDIVTKASVFGLLVTVLGTTWIMSAGTRED